MHRVFAALLVRVAAMASAGSPSSAPTRAQRRLRGARACRCCTASNGASAPAADHFHPGGRRRERVLRQQRSQRLRGGRAHRCTALEVRHARARQLLARGRGRRASTSAATTATSTPSTPPAASCCWKFATEGERRFSAPAPARRGAGRARSMPDPFDVFLSSPVVGCGHGLLRQWRRQRVRARSRAPARCAGSFKTGNVVHASPGARRRHALRRQLGQLLLCARCEERRAALALQDR